MTSALLLACVLCLKATPARSQVDEPPDGMESTGEGPEQGPAIDVVEADAPAAVAPQPVLAKEGTGISFEVVHAQGPEQPISLEEALSRAVSQNPQVISGQMSIEAAVAARKSARANFFPQLTTDLTFMVYSEKPGFGDVDMGGEMPLPDCSSVFDEGDEELLCTGLMEMMDFSGLSDQFQAEQWNLKFSVTVAQPLTPLYQAYHGYKLAELGVDVAEIELSKTEAELKIRTVEAYYGYLKASAGLKAIEEALVSVEAHVDKAKAFYDAEFITKNDLLQAEARFAEMKGQRLQMQQSVTLAREGLLLLLNEEPGTNIVPADQPDAELSFLVEGDLPTSEDEAIELARENRPELEQIGTSVAQAKQAVKLQKGGYIPTVSIFGTYQLEEGSVMEVPDFAFGAQLSWNFFQWGKVYYAVDEAKARVAAAEAGAEALERSVKYEVKQALFRIELASKQIEVQQEAVDSAEEQLRIEQERYEQKVNTTTEVLDATVRLVEAQVKLGTYQYDYLVAIATLKKACGTL
jgi:outer membrane protein